MVKLLSYPVSVLATIFFIFVLLFFHPVQWICFNVFGYQAHKRSVDVLNFFLMVGGAILGTTYKAENRELIPNGRPVIFVSNHQGMFDIIGFVWFMRKWHPKFVSKKELGKGIPSVSYNLNHGGSVLIDRKNPKQALPLIKSLGEYISKNVRSAVIFPEGTRSRNGSPKPFAETGLKILCRAAPDAVVVPVTINNSWKITKYGNFPFGLGNQMVFTVHPPLEVKEYSFEELFEKTEQAVKSLIKTEGNPHKT